MSYTDYPKSASKAAQRALDYAAKEGWGSCGTPVGKRRANQIANREPLSKDVVKRVYSFLSRHKQSAGTPYGEGCGGLMYDAWGGRSMLPWAKKKVQDMNMDKEQNKVRSKYGEDVELRTMEVRAGEGEELVIEGYAALYDEVTDLGYFREKISRGAFEGRTKDDVRLLLNHEGAPYARTTNGTLELTEDGRGLYYRATLAPTQAGKDLYVMIKRGDISQSSFAFTIAKDTWSEDRTLRTIERVGTLYDVSPTTYPAYSATSVKARSFAMGKEEVVLQEVETPQPKPEKKEKSNNLATECNTLHQMNFKTSTEAARYISQLEVKLRNLNDLAQTEERALTSEELQETEDIHAKLERAEKMRDSLSKNEARLKRLAVDAGATPREDKELAQARSRYSFGKALQEAAYGQVTGLEAEMSQEARNEDGARGLGLRGNFSIPSSFLQKRNVYGNDSTLGDVADAVTTTGVEVAELVGALRANSLLDRLGATRLQGFSGNVKMPSLPTDAAETPAEGATITGNTSAMGSATLSPQRLAQQMIITKEALNQATGNMGAVIAADFGRSIAVAQDAVAFKSITGAAGVGGTGQYVKATETGTNDLAATSAADVRDLWAAITANGAETETKFVAHPTIAAHLMGLPNVSSVDSLVMNGQIFGYDMLTGGSIPSIDLSAVNASVVLDAGADVALGANFAAVYFLYYGQFSDLFACTWGGLDVTIDPYSGSSAGNVKIVVDNYFDAKVRRAGSVGALVASAATILGADS